MSITNSGKCLTQEFARLAGDQLAVVLNELPGLGIRKPA
jgi:hypothetical protein